MSCNSAERIEVKDVVLPIIPRPQSIEVFDGQFILSSTTKIVASSPEQKMLANYFITELQKQFSITCSVVEMSGKTNQVILTNDKSLSEEAYSLNVGKEEINISASSEAGYFYAIQTLLQLTPLVLGENKEELKISMAAIKDKPRFVWRGMMLDISRHFFGLESLKKLVDQMSAQKMNRLHLHLSDNQGWRIEIKEYPKLHMIGGKGDYSNPDGPAMFLSEVEARDLTAYAKERQITIIPEVDLPGHSGAIARSYPEFSGDENTLNVSNPEAIKMIETVIHKLTDIFDTPYFHFGSDEVWGKSWEKRADTKAKMKELGFTSQKELEGWFDRKIADYIHDEGYIPVAWDEAAEFGVNKSTIIQNWRWKDTEVGVEVLNHGAKLIVSPSNYLYLDYPEHVDEAGAYWKGIINGPNTVELIYHWNPIDKGFATDKLENVLGIEAPIWTEFIPNQKRLEYMVYPRILAISEKAWTEDENMNWETFQKRMTAQFDRYDNLEINYRIEGLALQKRKELQPEAFEGPIPSEKSKFLKK